MTGQMSGGVYSFQLIVIDIIFYNSEAVLA